MSKKYVEKGSLPPKQENIAIPKDPEDAPSTEQPPPQARQTKNVKPKNSQWVEKGTGIPAQSINAATNNNPKAKNHPEGSDKPKQPWKKSYKKSRFDWDRRHVTLDTPVPELPKKPLTKPDVAALDQAIKKIQKQIQELRAERKSKQEEKRLNKKLVKNQKITNRMLSAENRTKLRELYSRKDELRTKFRQLVDSQKKVLARLKELRAQQHMDRSSGIEHKSKAELQRRRQWIENELIKRDDITKEQQRRFRSELDSISTLLVNAKDEFEIELEKEKAKGLARVEQQQMDRLNPEISEVKSQLDAIQLEINRIESIKEHAQEKQKSLAHTPEEIEEKYEQEIEAITDKIFALEDQIDSLEDKYRDEKEEYEREQQLIEYVKMVESEKKYIRQQNERYEKRRQEKLAEQEKRRKQREIQEKERERKREEYERIKKEREDRETKIQEERQKRLETLPFGEEKKLCQYLSDYCARLQTTPQEKVKMHNQERKEVELSGKEWEKETKKGAHLIKNKKEIEGDIVIGERPKKQKKPVTESAPKPESDLLEHHINVIRLFQKVNVLPPLRQAEIQQTITLLGEKFTYYSNPSQEDIEEHRNKIKKEMEEQDQARKQRVQERNRQHEPKPEAARNVPKKQSQPAKIILQTSDFPEL